MSDYPKTYRHPVTKQERNATNKAQEVSLKFDGFRVVEAEEAPAAEGDKPTDKADSETPPPAPKTAAPKPGPTPKAQEGK